MDEASTAGGRSPRAPAAGAIWAALIAVWILWGTTYLAIRVVNQSIPPLLGAASRFLVAGMVMLALTARRGPLPTARHWRNAAIIGALLVFGGNGLVSLAEDSISSGLAALLVALVPLWLATFDRILFGKRLRPIAVVGLVGGFGGAALLAAGSIAGDSDPLGVALVIVATLLWTAGSLFARKAELPERPLVGTGMEMLCGGGVQLAVGLALGELADLRWAEITPASAAAVGYLIVFGSLIAFSSYVWLLRVAPTSLVATYAFVNPIVAVLLGAVILDEVLTMRILVAGAIIVGSVALIVVAQRGSPTPSDEEQRESARAASGE